MAVTVQKNRQRTQLATLLADPDSFALTLITIFVDTYGMEALAWAPETVRLEIIDDFQVDLPQENFDKLMAAMHLSQTDEFYVSLPTFIEICNVLNGLMV